MKWNVKTIIELHLLNEILSLNELDARDLKAQGTCRPVIFCFLLKKFCRTLFFSIFLKRKD